MNMHAVDCKRNQCPRPLWIKLCVVVFGHAAFIWRSKWVCVCVSLSPFRSIADCNHSVWTVCLAKPVEQNVHRTNRSLSFQRLSSDVKQQRASANFSLHNTVLVPTFGVFLFVCTLLRSFLFWCETTKKLTQLFT